MDNVKKHKCYVCNHTYRSISARGLRFHQIPSKVSNLEETQKWLKFLHLPSTGNWAREQWRNITLCSLHFREEDYRPGYQDSFIALLNPGAVPTQNQPSGPGAYGVLFPPMLPHCSYSETLSVEDAEFQPPISLPMEDTVEEIPCTSTDIQVQTSLNCPHTSQRGAISKFRRATKFELNKKMGLPNQSKLISPRSTRHFNVAKYYRNKYQRLIRRRLVMPRSQSREELCEGQNQEVDLSAEVYASHQANTKLPIRTRRYSNRLKALCMALQGSGARVYRLLRQVFALPSTRTLTRTRQSVPLSSGISKAVLNSMVKQLSSMSEIDKICVLMFDEMSLEKRLDYDPVDDHILGYQDIGGCRYPTFADHSLVFMVRGLVAEWKQPVAFHLGQAIAHGNLENALRETVIALQEIGLKVVAIVSDMAQSNILALRTLAMKTMPERDDPVLKLGNDKIFIFADPPHLLKVLRNNFLKFDVSFKGRDGKLKTAKFDILKEFLEYEKQLPIPVAYPQKLSDRHLEPNSKEKMRVKYAAQLFSSTVSHELFAFGCKTGNNDAKDLSEFISIVDNLFDSLNAFSAKNDKNLRLCVTENSFHHVFWTDMLRSLKDWKFVVRSSCSNQPRSKCFYFWQRNIIAAQSLWREVRGLGVDSLKTRNLNQDPLECFFGSVRQQGGCNTNPSSRLFIDIFKILMLNSFTIKFSSKRGNVLQDNVSLLSDLLNSRSDNREENSLETVSGVEHVSTSLASLCTVSKEVESCTRCISEYISNANTEESLGCALTFLLQPYIRKHRNNISSCFNCFRSFYLCNHREPSPGKAMCDECSSLKPSLASGMFKIHILVLKELQKSGYESHLSEKLKVSVRDFPLHDLSCNEHRDNLHNTILTFIIRKTTDEFCLKVNTRLRALARKT